MIVEKDGLEWVWASPCALNGCTSGIDIGHDGFNFATQEQWELRPSQSDFDDGAICASPWFDLSYDHCDPGNPEGSAPVGGLPAGPDGTDPMVDFWETWLVRGEIDEIDECPIGEDELDEGVDEDELDKIADEVGLKPKEIEELCDFEADEADDDEQPRFLGPGFGAIVSGDQAAQNRARANAAGAAAAAAPAPAATSVRPPSTGDAGLAEAISK